MLWCMTISETLLPEYDQEMASTRKMLACVPDALFAWKPHAKSMALGRLASHIAEMPNWAEMTVKLPKLVIGPDFKPFAVATQAELLESFDKFAADGRTAIAGASDEDLAKIWELEFNGRTVISMPRSAVLRNMVMNHMIHHRAQLGVYLRLNDVAIPGMYGPSADERG
jgi:uncharacterized damage-inducible protein DinB